MSAIGDFFNNLFGKFLDFVTGLATELFTTSAKILVAELQEGAPMAIQWAREAVEAAEATGGDGGAKWDVLGGNLPSVQVADLQYQTRDNVIVVATYGRGMYLVDATKIR